MNPASPRPVAGQSVTLLGVCVQPAEGTRPDAEAVACLDEPPADGAKALRSAASHDRTPHNQPTLAETIADGCQNVSQEITDGYRLYYTMIAS
jgi:hypothetical protein